MDPSLVATLAGIALGVVACTGAFVLCRIWRRNRYYKKVQHSLDEEERAFQETLARSYHQDEESALDGVDRTKLHMLETYMQSLSKGDADTSAADDAPLPTRAEDVDKFMNDLAAAASGGGGAEPHESRGLDRAPYCQ